MSAFEKIYSVVVRGNDGRFRSCMYFSGRKPFLSLAQLPFMGRNEMLGRVENQKLSCSGVFVLPQSDAVQSNITIAFRR